MPALRRNMQNFAPVFLLLKGNSVTLEALHGL